MMMTTFFNFILTNQPKALTVDTDFLSSLLINDIVSLEDNKPFWTISNHLFPGYYLKFHKNENITIVFDKIILSSTGNSVYFYPNFDFLNSQIVCTGKISKWIDFALFKGSIVKILNQTFKKRRCSMADKAYHTPPQLHNQLKYSIAFKSEIMSIDMDLVEVNDEIKSFLHQIELG
jgi:hypothetical protein